MAVRRLASLSITYALLVVAFVCFTFPFFLLIVNSFKTNGDILENPFSIPKVLDFSRFSEVIEKMNFLVTFKNTFVITTLSVILILILSAMTAHYLVRNATKFNQTFFAILVASMIIPFQSIMIPLIYIYGAKLNLIETAPVTLLIALYIGFGSAFSVFIYHGFIKSIPLELEEASLIDGCTRRQTFFKIVLPMLAPTSVTIAILNVLWIWNDYLLPSLILTKEQDFTMPIKMKVFNGTYMNDWQLLIPAILLTILPILVAYLIGQRYIIRGVMQGAIK
ncbi:sugar ABC transporter permease [Paenibacillus darwinianus]|uniref:Sugar ABC transporter permease n=1 Tax=Paenibacillus darwinianus TaxID=1380763 RepID=A0A9W5S311_9BACL|nr:carbohydrate ABC transporter permease [Paenibacillus darwinianus]EXX90397.1 sugar ABC transporter permease [Paenibacillus darwinianus]EXX91083.1 sugar ABC transporter permease [Paenibacillus darwinianus]EXX91975.1 sugar ABC transporter permease [Paenibacillus darwinianus]